jgi:hypothetical protein
MENGTYNAVLAPGQVLEEKLEDPHIHESLERLSGLTGVITAEF